MSQEGPRISLVIPVYNSSDTIEKCLNSVLAQDHPAFEVIVVDDGSTDGTPDICESFNGVKVIRSERGGPSRARNRGVAEAKGGLVAFTDGDCIAETDWLAELEKGFTGPDVGGVGGDQKSPDDETELGKNIQEYFKTIGFITGYIKTGATQRETEHNPSCNSIYRKELLIELCGFDEALFPGEDVDLDLRITRSGYKLIYNPEACVGHYRPGTYRSFARMMRRYGECQAWLVKKHGFFRPIQYEPVALVVCGTAAAALIALNPKFWPVILLPVPILFLWFLFKTRRLAKSLEFTKLMFITLINWNWGFVAGLVGPSK